MGRQNECKVVSSAIGQDCCKPLDPSKPGKECSGGSAIGKCADPASYQTILDQLKAEIPSQKWVQIDGAPTETQLQQILMSGSPVGRAGLNHIDAVVGCRPCQGGPGGCSKGSGGTEYRLIDSLQDPSQVMWYSYNITVKPTPMYDWKASYYSMGASQNTFVV